MKTGNKKTIKSLEDEIACLYKERDNILVPFIISSIPPKIMDTFNENPAYFISSSIACFHDGKRRLSLHVGYKFPTKEYNPIVFVSNGTLEEVERIDLLIHNKRKLIDELQQNIQLASCC